MDELFTNSLAGTTFAAKLEKDSSLLFTQQKLGIHRWISLKVSFDTCYWTFFDLVVEIAIHSALLRPLPLLDLGFLVL